jgi:hypothetical protein
MKKERKREEKGMKKEEGRSVSHSGREKEEERMRDRRKGDESGVFV